MPALPVLLPRSSSFPDFVGHDTSLVPMRKRTHTWHFSLSKAQGSWSPKGLSKSLLHTDSKSTTDDEDNDLVFQHIATGGAADGWYAYSDSMSTVEDDEELVFQHVATGGEADGWYSASLLAKSPPSAHREAVAPMLNTGTFNPLAMLVFMAPVSSVAVPCEDRHIDKVTPAQPPKSAPPARQRDAKVARMEMTTQPRTKYSRRASNTSSPQCRAKPQGRVYPFNPIPAASDEVWQARGEKRKDAVTLVQRSQAYKDCASAGRELPPLPDALDFNISKRQWEQKLRDFRNAVKAIAAELPPAAQ